MKIFAINNATPTFQASKEKIIIDSLKRSRIKLSDGTTAIIDRGYNDDILVKMAAIIANKGKKVAGFRTIKDIQGLPLDDEIDFLARILKNESNQMAIYRETAEFISPKQFGKFDVIG